MSKSELQSILNAEGFSSAAYSLSGSDAHDTLCLSQEHGRWCVYYTEHGDRFDESFFSTESEACEFLLEWIRSLLEEQTKK